MPHVVWHMDGAGSICQMSFGTKKAPVPYAKCCLAYGWRPFHMPNVVWHMEAPVPYSKYCLAYGRRRFYMPNVVWLMEGAGTICQMSLMSFGIWMAPFPYAKCCWHIGRRLICQMSFGIWNAPVPYAKCRLAYERRRFHMPTVVSHMETAGSIC